MWHSATATNINQYNVYTVKNEKTHYRLRLFSASQIMSAHPERSFVICFPQNLITIQPSRIRILFTSSSRSMLRSIFGIQYSRRVPIRSFACSQSYPCQNSLSQKTATFFPMNAMSGWPIILLQFLR